MMECLDILLQNKFDPQAQNLYEGGGETMLFYALKTRKYKSARKLLEYIDKANISTLKKGRNNMIPLAACIISPSIEFFKLLLERETVRDPDNIQIEDLTLTRRMYSFVHYLCKKHRVTQGNNQELKEIFEYLRGIGY
jgi:hypothetical protein